MVRYLRGLCNRPTAPGGHMRVPGGSARLYDHPPLTEHLGAGVDSDVGGMGHRANDSRCRSRCHPKMAGYAERP